MKLKLGKKAAMLFFLAVIGSVFFTGCGIRYIINSSTTLKKEDAKEFKLEKTKVDPIKEIDVSTRVADIEIIQSDDYYVEIAYTYWEDTPEYTMENGVMHFDDSDAFPASYSINFNLKNKVKIYLPESASVELIDLRNSSGDVTGESFIAGELKVSVAYGDLTLKNAAAAKCNFELSSGKSKITDFSAGDLKYSNSYGNAEFKNINTGTMQLPDDAPFNSFTISMSSGNIDIDSMKTSSTKISNSYGDVTCDDITSLEFDASLSSGDVDISKGDFNDVSISNSYGNVDLSLPGTEKDYNMDLSTSYGDIKVDNENYEDSLNVENGGTREISADLSSGDINIKFN
jgi:DUF4097 and DUF4098 domain-containing protein YvlB